MEHKKEIDKLRRELHNQTMDTLELRIRLNNLISNIKSKIVFFTILFTVQAVLQMVGFTLEPEMYNFIIKMELAACLVAILFACYNADKYEID